MDRLTKNQQAEIEASRGMTSKTLRALSPGLEEILYKPIDVLDHGFVRVVDYMGNDEAVVQAARVSYGRGTKKSSEDAGLISYLLRHSHTTPFEMAEIKLHVKLPIFVARQWIRHRTANVNEYSARYSILDREFYIPAPEHLAAQTTSNRQGRENVLTATEAEVVLAMLRDDSEKAYEHYRKLLNIDENDRPIDSERQGLARELARMNLPVNYYTQWYWKIDLHNLMGFLRLRADPHAQYEIRVYANVIMQILERWVPLTHRAFVETRIQGAQISSAALNVVRRLVAGKEVSQPTSGLSKREWSELCELLQLVDR